jgi:hypothetical protein
MAAGSLVLSPSGKIALSPSGKRILSAGDGGCWYVNLLTCAGSATSYWTKRSNFGGYSYVVRSADSICYTAGLCSPCIPSGGTDAGTVTPQSTSCCSGCCVSCAQAGACCPTQWTVTFSDVTISACVAGNGLAVGTTGALDGTYEVPYISGASACTFWALNLDNILWEEDEGASCVTPPDQPYRILIQDGSPPHGVNFTLQVDGGAVAQDLLLFYDQIPTVSSYPCSSISFTNQNATCGTDGYTYRTGCGGTAVVTAC